MAPNTPQTKWSRCLEIIKCNVKEQEYNTWFSPIECLAYEKATEELLLGVPSNYFFEILDGQFKRLMYNVVWRVFGKGAHIIYRIKTDSTNNIVTDVEASSVSVAKQQIDPKKNTLKEPTRKTVVSDLDSQLNDEYRFENFIEGESNRLPRSVGESIAENPKQTTFNPLFIYGSSGVGKTHLVNAIGIRLKEKFPEKRVLYVSAHLFKVQYTDSVRNNTFNDFINFYQTIDVLIIDDIQELAGREKTQEAFFHIFNHLKMTGKQIILTSDRAPATMQGMEERLLTRFKWGLIAELEQPNQELCQKILESKIHRDGLDIPEDVIDYIASNVTSSVRDLEGIVNSLMAYSVVYNRNIDLPLAEQIIRRAVRLRAQTISLDEILDETSAYFGVALDDVFSKSRKANIVEVRQTAMFLAQKYTKMSASKIGLRIGGRNHATVLHSINQVNDRMAVDKKYVKTVQEIEKRLKNRK